MYKYKSEIASSFTLLPAMALLGNEYASSDEETPPTAPTVVAAPDVSLDVWSHSAKTNDGHSANTM